jgi:hypothetical protein
MVTLGADMTCLNFADTFNSDEYELLEVTEELAEKFMK